MKKLNLIFIPYQDTDNYYADGILTREYAMLYIIAQLGIDDVINIKKPRSWLDKRRYSINEYYYPEGTIEYDVKRICENATTIQYNCIFSLGQIIRRRGWWIDGYKRIERRLMEELKKQLYIVYSDNPYAVELLKMLKGEGCYIYFDVMDNFAIHPSLHSEERECALKSYTDIMRFADIVSANSLQTCDYMEQKTGRRPVLIKNGVFPNNEIANSKSIECISSIREQKKGYRKCVGYIGKLGLRIDADLIDKLSDGCKDVLFVIVGPYLKGQFSKKLMNLIQNKKNIVHIEGIPSAYVYSVLDEFDILMIPHATGKAENGGDPLKLYQYMTRRKPIITTPILGVDEFSDYITISDDPNEWIEFINGSGNIKKSSIPETINWFNRFEPISMEIKAWIKSHS